MSRLLLVALVFGLNSGAFGVACPSGSVNSGPDEHDPPIIIGKDSNGNPFVNQMHLRVLVREGIVTWQMQPDTFLFDEDNPIETNPTNVIPDPVICGCIVTDKGRTATCRKIDHPGGFWQTYDINQPSKDGGKGVIKLQSLRGIDPFIHYIQ
jgi:hypothetical protein